MRAPRRAGEAKVDIKGEVSSKFKERADNVRAASKQAGARSRRAAQSSSACSERRSVVRAGGQVPNAIGDSRRRGGVRDASRRRGS